jgi:hypothetical protein
VNDMVRCASVADTPSPAGDRGCCARAEGNGYAGRSVSNAANRNFAYVASSRHEEIRNQRRRPYRDAWPTNDHPMLRSPRVTPNGLGERRRGYLCLPRAVQPNTEGGFAGPQEHDSSYFGRVKTVLSLAALVCVLLGEVCPPRSESRSTTPPRPGPPPPPPRGEKKPPRPHPLWQKPHQARPRIRTPSRRGRKGARTHRSPFMRWPTSSVPLADCSR